uniref:Myb-like domain-containing protein n=1 Tax=Hyaloperonospora arabidopsidis (strain Emoy2) TaxID=559515 RepID=M4C0Y7_HYAAE
MEPEELQAEPRWSSIRYPPHPLPAQWKPATDEQLMRLVTQSTASGERFPVGVNWLEVSRVVRRSPVDCVKRYAILHEARERYEALGGKEQDLEVKMEAKGDDLLFEKEVEGGLSDSGDEFFEEQSLSDFATPVASPKLESLDLSEDFTPSRPTSPESSPPFAVTRLNGGKQAETAVPGRSPFRWESLVDDPNYNAPMLNSPPSLPHKDRLQSRFGSEDEEVRDLSLALSPRLSSRGLKSPPRTQGHISEMRADPNYPASVLTHAFKGLTMSALPVCAPHIGSPRVSHKISNSEYPFLKDDEQDAPARQSAASSMSRSERDASGTAASLSSRAYGMGSVNAGDLHRQVNAHLMYMSTLSGSNAFSGSVTQSALEDAFLDMAGSRLDASNVLLGSRMSAPFCSHKQLPDEQFQAKSADNAPR